jgi:hypothetical protein
MSLPLTLPAGASAELCRVDGERFLMRATRAYAPGTPLKASVDGTGEVLDLKVARSVRTSEGSFNVDGRLVNLTRAQRTLIEGSLIAPSAR